ncbi:hypothetical protein C1I91_20180 [Clostridium manihotivorum]|uniref:Uncharacterized protein n=1 Tax=Clostridium manihotivorum TaxID=2320868 RepID=A0A3R5THT0_9CLOT|nr:hypothetical protein C1I91_20180 [Clostridium manihotivorum]
MRKFLGEVCFYLTLLMFTYISWSVYLHLPFTNAPLIIFVLLTIVFCIAYCIFSNRLITTKENYKNKNLYIFVRIIMFISLTSYVFLIEYNEFWILVLWFVIIAVSIINKKQTQ